jgi:glycerol-3-phosphate acyltransferase PlsX
MVIEGVLEAHRRAEAAFVAHLCGDERVCESILESRGVSPREHADWLVIEHSPQNIEPGDIPSRVWRKKTHSSIVRSISLQKEGRVDATLSAGDTRILMGAAIFILGRWPGVARPALAAFLPTTAGRPTLVLDVGANLECRASHLTAFGTMGHRYYRDFFDIPNPTVALLNIGKEPTKGTRAIVDAGKALADRCEGYTGFIEGSCVLSGDADVVVCDGFTGNVLLKSCESFHRLAETVLGGEKKLWSAVAGKMSILDAANYGAVPLVGIEGVVFKAHGSSTSQAITHALLTAVQQVVKQQAVGQTACS